MLSSRAELEEERRLFYVAITRAQKKLYLSYALTRYRYGRLKNCEPSRFLDDVDSRYMKVSTKFGMESFAPNTNFAKSFVSGMKKTVSSVPVQKATSYRPSADFLPSDTSGLKEGHESRASEVWLWNGYQNWTKVEPIARPGSISMILVKRHYYLTLPSSKYMRIRSRRFLIISPADSTA